MSIYVSTAAEEPPIVIDTGASASITPLRSDFTGPLDTPDLHELRQVNGLTQVLGQGLVRWKVEDMAGEQQI